MAIGTLGKLGPAHNKNRQERGADATTMAIVSLVEIRILKALPEPLVLAFRN
jgi:hypothetical protein